MIARNICYMKLVVICLIIKSGSSAKSLSGPGRIWAGPNNRSLDCGNLGSEFVPIYLIAMKSLLHCNLVYGTDPGAIFPSSSSSNRGYSWDQIAADVWSKWTCGRLGPIQPRLSREAWICCPIARLSCQRPQFADQYKEYSSLPSGWINTRRTSARL